MNGGLSRLASDLDLDEAEAQRDGLAHAEPSSAALFTFRVLGALPSRLAFTRLSPRRRVAVLALFHAVALAAGYGVLRLFSDEADVVGSTLAWLEPGVSTVWWAAAVAVVGIVAFLPWSAHTRAT